MKKPDIKNVKVGMVFKVRSKRYGKINYVRVTKRPKFEKKGDRPDIFYAVFVNPKNFKKKRFISDVEFAVWDYSYSGSLADKWVRVK